jgi:hypothetical protein
MHDELPWSIQRSKARCNANGATLSIALRRGAVPLQGVDVACIQIYSTYHASKKVACDPCFAGAAGRPVAQDRHSYASCMMHDADFEQLLHDAGFEQLLQLNGNLEHSAVVGALLTRW